MIIPGVVQGSEKCLIMVRLFFIQMQFWILLREML
ncbi:hypothetical protein ECBCE019MS13_0805, partial [Escherichia coli BCE019_MS-13]